jgi:hypothetical protein
MVSVVLRDHFRTLNQPTISSGFNWYDYSPLQHIILNGHGSPPLVVPFFSKKERQ